MDFDKEFVILEVCSPAEAKTLLETQIEIGYFLPCKLAVYEKNDSVYIGAPRLTTQIGLTDNKEGLMETAQELESILKGAIEKAV